MLGRGVSVLSEKSTVQAHRGSAPCPHGAGCAGLAVVHVLGGPQDEPEGSDLVGKGCDSVPDLKCPQAIHYPLARAYFSQGRTWQKNSVVSLLPADPTPQAQALLCS